MRAKLCVAGLIVLAVAGCARPAAPPDLAWTGPPLTLRPVAEGLLQPVFATPLQDSLLIVEQAGRVLVRDPGGQIRTFLDVRDEVGSGGERGLLGLAVPPNFPTDSRVYVHFTNRGGTSVLARVTVDPGQGVALRETLETLVTQPQPFSNHNGGMIAFGPDGHLYWGLGDGGGAGDPEGNGQSLETRLGKILRLDVRPPTGYRVPVDNPFPDSSPRREIWAYGLRNPWRFSFDSATGDLYIGDVGQYSWEEVNRARNGTGAGANYGWNVFEGYARFRAGQASDHVAPVHVYATGSSGTCSVTAGYVYRGTKIAGLVGQFVFGDYCSGHVWALHSDGAPAARTLLLDTGRRISSFGQEADGELLVVDHGGAVLRLGPR